MFTLACSRIDGLFLALLFPFAAALSVRGDEKDVIINEIMYHPPSELQNLQFVELFNRGQTAVDLSNWSFSKGIKYVFPQGARIGPGSYLAVCRNTQDFSARYGAGIAALGNFSGKLSHTGDRLELSNSGKQIVDSVKYSDHGEWPMGPDGHSPSLERICSDVESQRAENWATSKLPPIKQPSGTPGRRNDNYSTNLPPAISKVEFSPTNPRPQEKVTVRATVADADGVKTVTLLFRTASTGRQSTETPLEMKRISGEEKSGVYEATIDGHLQGALVRFRIKALDAAGMERMQPSENEPSWTYSYYTFSSTAKAAIPLGFVINVSPPDRGETLRRNMPWRMPGPAQHSPVPTRGNSAFVYVPPDGGEPQTFDHVRVTPRKGGYKVHFQKRQALKGMTTVNIIFEQSPRWVLAEPLAYEVYRLAGIPAESTEHIRLWVDGRLLGYHLLLDQPDKSFLTRHGRDDSGNMYKLQWFGQGVVGKHVKKTNRSTGHDDLLKVINGLNKKSGADQWEFIKENFNVEELVNYFVVNMCIQNWDGFFNNYFAYHDVGGTGKWEMYPWDEDKTWGDYDGASPEYDWCEMPLTYGMQGDESPAVDRRSRANRVQGPFGGVSWWRNPGYFSGPLLANPEFRKRFLARLREFCTTTFTDEKIFPIINAMERRLEPEIAIRGNVPGEEAQYSLQRFHKDIQSFRNQVQNRRKFILAELNKTNL
ncbi:MAG: CotH kinase family protein [Verrucomicrobiota bacterium]